MMALRNFISPRLLATLEARFEEDVAYYRSNPPNYKRRDGNFLTYERMALEAYLLDRHDIALEFMRAAVERGFPPDFPEDGTDDFSIQWKRWQDGGVALRIAIAAHICGLPERHDEVLAWALERLSQIDFLVERGNHPSCGSAALARTYAHLAAGQAWPLAEQDLLMAVRLLKRGDDTVAERPLAEALLRLVKFQKGETDRSQTARELRRLLLNALPDARITAAFHVLYLQDRFPEAFDPVLPPLGSR